MLYNKIATVKPVFKNHSYFEKLYFDGKSYKMYKKKNVIYFRFNKRNKELFI